MAGSTNGAPSLEDLLAVPRRDRTENEQLIVACVPEVRACVEREMSPGLRTIMPSEDVRQDVLLNVCRKIAQANLPNVRALRGWLRTLVKNLLVDIVRRHLKTRGRLTRASSLEKEVCDDASRVAVRPRDLLPGREPGPYAALRKGECAEMVRRGLRRLAPSHRDVLERVVFRGESIDDIARKEEKSREAVWKRFRRALAALRSTMGSESFTSLFRSSSR